MLSKKKGLRQLNRSGETRADPDVWGNVNFLVAVDFLVVKPMTKQTLCSCKVSFANHWKHKRRALDVGHRGMGSSHGDPAKKWVRVFMAQHIRERKGEFTAMIVTRTSATFVILVSLLNSYLSQRKKKKNNVTNQDKMQCDVVHLVKPRQQNLQQDYQQ